MSDFQLVFNLTVTHNYYKNKMCPGLQFVPSAGTAAVFNRYGFKIISRINGFQLFVHTISPVPSLLKYIQVAGKQAFFQFSVKDISGELMNVTDWPLNWKGRFVFDNSAVINTVIDDAILLNASFEQADCMGGSLMLHIDTLIELLKKGTLNYSIRLSARATQWQYYIVNRSNITITDPVVRDRSGIGFSEPAVVVIPSGEKALYFSSQDRLLLLSQVPAFIFDLVDFKRDTQGIAPSGKIVYKGLPTPDPLTMDIVVIKGKMEAASPVYVYL